MSKPLPSFDLRSLGSPRPEHWRRTAEAIGAACREWGFFCLRGHGIDRTVLDEVWANVRSLLARPLAGKGAVLLRAGASHDPKRAQP